MTSAIARDGPTGVATLAWREGRAVNIVERIPAIGVGEPRTHKREPTNALQ